MKGLVIVAGPAKKGGSDVEAQERRNAMRAFIGAVQGGDVEAAIKAYGRVCEAGPPPMDEGADDAEEEAPDNAPKDKKASMYRDEED